MLCRYLLAAAASEGQSDGSPRDAQHMLNFRSTLMQVLEAVSQVCGMVERVGRMVFEGGCWGAGVV